jgi:DNA polymerase V
MGVVGLRVVHELRGLSCLPLEDVPPAKQSCCVSRSFGEVVTDLGVMKEAVANHAARAAEKLRRDGLAASHVAAFMWTDRFGDDGRMKPQSEYEAAATADLGGWTADSRRLVGAAVAVAERLFRPGKEYKKAGVLLPFLEAAATASRSLFERPDPRSEKLMKAVDAVSTVWGKGTVRLASQGVQVGKGWEMTQSRRSRSYTTRIEDLPVVRA